MRYLNGWCILILATLAPRHAPGDITFIGAASIPGDARDKSGLSGVLGDSTPQDRLGAFGSGIAWTGRGNRYIAVDDRGPADGATAFRDRFQTFEIVINPGKSPAVSVSLVTTTLLSSAAGEPLTGSTAAFDAYDQIKGLRLDPEGVRVSPAGTLWISDEYGPWLDEFSMDGKRLRHIAPPAKFMIAHPGAEAKDELREHSGRQANRGLEGLAISPDGTKLFAILQSPLIQDGALDAAGKRSGINCRVLETEVATGKMREFVYQLGSPQHGVNEILAVNDHEFLVLERDGKAGKAAKSRALYKIDLKTATDVSQVDRLPTTGVPDGVVPATKSMFLDFMDPKFGLAGDKMPEKIEGLAFEPDLPDGRHTLIVTTDNDLRADTPSIFWVFAIDAQDLPGFVLQRFSQDSIGR